MRLLGPAEQLVYDTMMGMIKKKKLRCWNISPPEGFISESERDGFVK